MELLSSDQIALLCRDALSREPAASRCPDCGSERQLSWEFDLECPSCGAACELEVMYVRPAGSRWQAVDLIRDKVAAVGDTVETAFNRARAAITAGTPAVIVITAPAGISAIAYPSSSDRPRGMPSNEEVRAASHLGVRSDE